MTARQKSILKLAVPFFVGLAFVPFMNTGPKGGWVPVWAAYLIFVGSVYAGEWGAFCLATCIIIALHIGLSIALAGGLTWLIAKKRSGDTELQLGAAPNGVPSTRSGGSGVGGGPPSVT